VTNIRLPGRFSLILSAIKLVYSRRRNRAGSGLAATGGIAMTTEMATELQAKPEYLGLLNAISLAESNAGVYLKAWADVTPDPSLRQALAFVAARETTHGAVFCQRIERLGFALREREDPDLEGRLRLYGDPTISDIEKIRHPRYGRRSENGESEGNDPFAGINARINDETVDSLTRDTLRWFVAEERDSGAVLREAYARVEAQANGQGAYAGGSNGGAPGVSADAQAIMACMTQGFAALQQSITDLTGALAKQVTSKQK
jgi:hypothetical protein